VIEKRDVVVAGKWAGTISVVEGFSPRNPDYLEASPMHHNKIRSRLKAQLCRFSSQLTAGLSKPLRNFVNEMLFGIQASQDVKLSNIARSLEEEIPLLKTEDRLSRNLGADELETHLRTALLRLGSHRVENNTVLCLDLSDVRKEHARKMEFLDRVWDGSEGESAPGYWLCSIVGAEVHSHEITPLYQQLFSMQTPEFVSENQELLSALDRLREHTQGRGIWAIDRGGDRRALLQPLLERGERFVIRSTGKRKVVDHWGRWVAVHSLGARCRLRYQAQVVKIENGTEKIHRLRYGALPIRLPGCAPALQLVVVAGWGEEPMLLLTNVCGVRDSQSLWWIVQIYLTRWKIEETFRFIKQSYHVEDIRVLRYQRLKNLILLVTAAAFFATTFLGQKLKLRVLCEKLLIISQRFFGIPPFRFYALADGIRQLLSGTSPNPSPAEPPPSAQLELLLGWQA
jgi:Transposase DDE domain